MGAVACELQSLGHRPNFFYLQHAMGLASSVGLGLALCLPDRKVVVFDGDGSVLMNLGGLHHPGAVPPAQPGARDLRQREPALRGRISHGDLHRQRISKASRARPAFRRTLHGRGRRRVYARRFDAAMQSEELTCMVAKVEAVGPKGYVTDLALLENRFQFQRHIQKLEGKIDRWPNILAELVTQLRSGSLRVVDLTQPLSAADAAAAAAAAVAQHARIPHVGDLALRRARPRLVLERLRDRRAHRHALRRAHPLGHAARICPKTASIRFQPAKFVGPACVIDVTARCRGAIPIFC